MTKKIDDNSKEIESVCTYCGVGCDITAVVEDNKIAFVGSNTEAENCWPSTLSKRFNIKSNKTGL